MRKGHLSWRTAPAVTVLAVAALSVVVSAGCSKSPEERITEAAIGAITGKDVAVDKDGEKVTFGSGDEAVTISGGDAAELPATFPKDVWLPSDYKVESVMDSTGFTMVSLRADHSRAFWREVEARFPGWRDERAWFHAEGRRLKATLRALLG